MIWDAQKAIFAALSANTSLMTAIGSRLYDQPPQNATFPYVVIGEGGLAPWDTDNEVGAETQVTVNVWDRSHRGRKVVKELQDMIMSTLHRTEPLVTGMSTVLCEMELADSFMDPDGLSFQGIQRFRLIFEEVET